MFVLHSSNLTENLVQHLAGVIQAKPLASPFSSEIFLIQSQGMERWVAQQLANALPVWANYEVLFPAKFFNELAQLQHFSLNAGQFDRFELVWHFEHLLRKPTHPDLQPLSHYLGQASQPSEDSTNPSGDPLKRFYFARQLAMLFDQYQMMRPHLLNDWQKGRLSTAMSDEKWQMVLWQQLTEKLGTNHRGNQWLALIERFENTPVGQLQGLPERVHLFGLNTLAPLFLQLVSALAKHIDVHLYLLSPSASYWGDVQSPKQLAKQRGKQANQAVIHSQQTAFAFSENAFSENDEAVPSRFTSELDSLTLHNPFLSALGQQGREFHNLLLAQPIALDIDSFETPFATDAPKTCIQTLQETILNNAPITPLALPADNSIRILACHTQLREVQTLKNQLLDCIAQQPDLAWRDLIVMAPDIQKYVPFIETVFSDVPYAIADKTLKNTAPSVEAFSLFITLIQGRFGWESIMSLLSMPVVCEACGLSEPELEWIEKWVSDTQIRWGKSETHRAELGLPAMKENTWQAGIERMLMGLMMHPETQADGRFDFVQDILPYYEIEGSSNLILGKFVEFVQFLFAASEAVKVGRTRAQWQQTLSQFANQLLGNALGDDNALSPLIEALYQAPLNETPHEIEADSLFDVRVIAAWLATQVDERKTSSGFLRGQLTFCSMLPMRAIPFKVIAILGMNEGAFPQVERPLSFDLIAQQFQAGDRSRRADERYQFLEILLSVRATLIISFIGQSIHTNDSLPPAVVVAELIQQLQTLTGQENWIQTQPLHAFSSQYFDAANPQLFSYDTSALEAAQAFNQAKQHQCLSHEQSDAAVNQWHNQTWWQGALNTDSSNNIDVADLFGFFKSPQEYFVKQQLDLILKESTTQFSETEPFSVDGLDKYIIMNTWFEVLQQQNGQPVQDKRQANQLFVNSISAQGKWLMGTPGKLSLQANQQVLMDYVSLWQQLNLAQTLDNHYFDIVNAHWHIQGQVPQARRYPHAWVMGRFSSMKPKDIIGAWLLHLLQTCDQSLTTLPTYLLMENEQKVFLPLEYDQAWWYLEDLLQVFKAGLSAPSELIIECAWAWMSNLADREQKEAEGKASRKQKTALQEAEEELSKLLERKPEYKLLYGQVENLPAMLEAAQPLMEQVMRPLITSCCGLSDWQNGEEQA